MAISMRTSVKRAPAHPALTHKRSKLELIARQAMIEKLLEFFTGTATDTA